MEFLRGQKCGDRVEMMCGQYDVETEEMKSAAWCEAAMPLWLTARQNL